MGKLVTDEMVEQALAAQSIPACEKRAAAKAEHLWAADELKAVEADLIAEAPDPDKIGLATAWARRQESYKFALAAKREITRVWSVEKEIIDAAERILDVWRTQQSDARRQGIR